MKIVQITDVHVGMPEEKPFGVNIRTNFIEVLEKAKKEKPDFLVLSGDLCYKNGIKEIYDWQKTYLDQLSFPYYIIGGNHDDVPMMASVFELEESLTNDELYFSKKLREQHCLFIDSSKGKISNTQYNWIKKELKQQKEALFIFMHHPPAYCGVPYMDKNHAFQEIEKFQTILFQYNLPIYIFTGHFHIEQSIYIKNLMIHITPSTFFQLDSNVEEFQVAHHKIGYRLIEKTAKGIQTAVKYVL